MSRERTGHLSLIVAIACIAGPIAAQDAEPLRGKADAGWGDDVVGLEPLAGFLYRHAAGNNNRSQVFGTADSRLRVMCWTDAGPAEFDTLGGEVATECRISEWDHIVGGSLVAGDGLVHATR